MVVQARRKVQGRLRRFWGGLVPGVRLKEGSGGSGGAGQVRFRPGMVQERLWRLRGGLVQARCMVQGGSGGSGGLVQARNRSFWVGLVQARSSSRKVVEVQGRFQKFWGGLKCRFKEGSRGLAGVRFKEGSGGSGMVQGRLQVQGRLWRFWGGLAQVEGSRKVPDQARLWRSRGGLVPARCRKVPARCKVQGMKALEILGWSGAGQVYGAGQV